MLICNDCVSIVEEYLTPLPFLDQISSWFVEAERLRQPGMRGWWRRRWRPRLLANNGGMLDSWYDPGVYLDTDIDTTATDPIRGCCIVEIMGYVRVVPHKSDHKFWDPDNHGVIPLFELGDARLMAVHGLRWGQSGLLTLH
jgi:hypothetical protein